MKTSHIRCLIALLLSVSVFNNCVAELQPVSTSDELASIEAFDRAIKDTEQALNLALKVESELRLQTKANDKVLATMVEKSNNKAIPVEMRDKYAASAKTFSASLKQSGKNQSSLGQAITNLRKRLNSITESKKFYIDMMKLGEKEDAAKVVKDLRELPMLAEHWKTILKECGADAHPQTFDVGR